MASEGMSPVQLLSAATTMLKEAQKKESEAESKLVELERRSNTMKPLRPPRQQGPQANWEDLPPHLQDQIRRFRSQKKSRTVKKQQKELAASTKSAETDGEDDEDDEDGAEATEGYYTQIGKNLTRGDIILVESENKVQGTYIGKILYISIEKTDRYGLTTRLKFGVRDLAASSNFSENIYLNTYDSVICPIFFTTYYQVATVDYDNLTFTYVDDDGNEVTKDLPTDENGDLTPEAQMMVDYPPDLEAYLDAWYAYFWSSPYWQAGALYLDFMMHVNEPTWTDGPLFPNEGSW